MLFRAVRTARHNAHTIAAGTATIALLTALATQWPGASRLASIVC